MMMKAMARAINFMVKKFLARKLRTFLVYAPKSMLETADGSVLAVLEDIMLSTAAMAAAWREAKSSAAVEAVAVAAPEPEAEVVVVLAAAEEAAATTAVPDDEPLGIKRKTSCINIHDTSSCMRTKVRERVIMSLL